MKENNDTKRELYRKVNKQHYENMKKWGYQRPELLHPILMEEIGEISKEFLQNHYGDKEGDIEQMESEIIDAMAVLVEMYEETRRWNYEQ